LIAGLGGFLFGLDTAVISGAMRSLESRFSLDPFWLGFTVTAALIGTIVGSLLAELPLEKYGRKRTLLGIAGLFLASSLASTVAPNWVALVSSRFAGGIAIGLASVASPIYIAEIAPASLRGRLVSITQLNIVLGILCAFLSNYFVALWFHGDDVWRSVFAVVVLPSALFLILGPVLVESPRWLLTHGREAEAREALSRLGHPEISRTVEEIRESFSVSKSEDRLFQRRYLRPILLAFAMAMFNQLTGISALTYAPRIFGMAGASVDNALLQSVAIGVTSLVFTILAMALIDRVGRRKLIIWGSCGYICALGLLAWLFLHPGDDSQIFVLICILAFQAVHALSQGAVLWVFVSEIFPNSVRAKGQSLATFIHWVMAAAITWSFPAATVSSAAGIFGFFAVMMVLQLFFAWKIMPETRNSTLEEIEDRLSPVKT
jgi:sugar porter (SP) family MFS transporter